MANLQWLLFWTYTTSLDYDRKPVEIESSVSNVCLIKYLICDVHPVFNNSILKCFPLHTECNRNYWNSWDAVLLYIFSYWAKKKPKKKRQNRKHATMFSQFHSYIWILLCRSRRAVEQALLKIGFSVFSPKLCLQWNYSTLQWLYASPLKGDLAAFQKCFYHDYCTFV